MKLSRELKTAIIVLGGILLFILGFTYLKSSTFFDTSRTYYAVYENVNGLTSGTAVTINGLQVGRIKDISFLDEKGNLLVTFSVENNFQFSKDSKAEIYDTGIIGGKSLRVLPSNGDTNITAKSGDTLVSGIQPGITELVTNKLTPLQEKIERVMITTDSVLVGVDQVLDQETREHLRQSIKGLNETVSNFNKTSKDLSELVNSNKESLNSSIANIDKITGNFSTLSDTLAQVDIAQIVQKLNNTATNLDAVIAGIKEGEGSLGLLMKDKELYENLSKASGELDLLLEDMRLNPKLYVHFSLFGKKPGPYEPATEEEINDQ